MGNGGVAALPPQREGQGSIGGDELARGLILVRASALKMARLQVAIESRDRRLVLQTMDDLVSLDGEMRDLVEQIPRSDLEIDLLQDELEQQRAALAREKLALVGGISRREQRSSAHPDSGIPSTLPAVDTPARLADPAEPGELHADFSPSDACSAGQESEPRNWSASVLALAIVVLLFGALAGAVLILGADDPQATLFGLFQTLGG